MEARRYLQDIGGQVSADFVKNRSILSFEEYVTLFFNDPRSQARNAAQYLHDVMDHYGAEQVGKRVDRLPNGEVVSIEQWAV